MPSRDPARVGAPRLLPRRRPIRSLLRLPSLLLLLHLLLLLLLFPPADAGGCPNKCSGKGSCSAYGQCTCFAGYGGWDCSERTCAQATAWAGIATATDTIHDNLAECSNMGTCDTKTGLCKCFAGFTGQACERLACPGGGNCNGNGRCLSMRDAA